DGTPVRSDIAFWGQHTPSGMLSGPDGKEALHFSGTGATTMTVALDPTTHTWRAGFRLQFPSGFDRTGALVCFFTEGGKNFGVFSLGGDNRHHSWFAVVRFEEGRGTVVGGFRFARAANAMVTSPGHPLRTPAGKPVAGLRFLQDGRLVAGGCVIPCKE